MEDIIQENQDTPLADKLEDVLGKTETTQEEMMKDPPDYQAALGNLEGVVGDLEAVVNDGLLDPTEGNYFMNYYAEIARQLAVNTINKAIELNGNQDTIDEALGYLSEGDDLREQEKFKDAINKYKDALAKAESAI